MIANVNPITKIPYGVIDARKCTYLWETIVNKGRNVTIEGFEDRTRKDLTENLSYALGQYEADVGAFAADGRSQFYIFVKDLLEKLPLWQKPLRVQNATEDIVENRYDPVSNTFSISEVVELILDHYIQDMLDQLGSDDTSDHTFYWTNADKTYSYQVSTLGGAPLLWVLKSPFVTPCRECSPRVPNAGNLDDMAVLGAHNCLAYCVEPDDIDCEEDRPKELYNATEYTDVKTLLAKEAAV